MTEDEARELLQAWPGLGGLEAWIARQPWEVAPVGWLVEGMLQGWSFRLKAVPAGLQITAGEPGVGRPAVWTVTGTRRPVMAR